MELSEEQIKDGFWRYRPDRGFPPAPISYPQEYGGEPELSLVCTQLNISAYRQRRLVEEWCRILPGLKGLKYLWFDSRASQSMLDAACQIPNLVGLFVKWGGITNLSGLSEPTQLKYLHLGSSPGVKDITALTGLKQLVVLEIENFKGIRRLDPLSELRRLEGLAVEGSTWTTQIVETLYPLRQLQELRYLFLTNLRALDGTLVPLLELKKLIHLRTAYHWPISEFKLLREALPELTYGSPFEQELIDCFGKRT